MRRRREGLPLLAVGFVLFLIAWGILFIGPQQYEAHWLHPTASVDTRRYDDAFNVAVAETGVKAHLDLEPSPLGGPGMYGWLSVRGADRETTVAKVEKFDRFFVVELAKSFSDHQAVELTPKVVEISSAGTMMTASVVALLALLGMVVGLIQFARFEGPKLAKEKVAKSADFEY